MALTAVGRQVLLRQKFSFLRSTLLSVDRRVVNTCQFDLYSSDSPCSSAIHIINEEKWPVTLRQAFERDCHVVLDFITDAEEATLCDEVAPRLKRLRYEQAHWDDAIHLYRETERSQWSPTATSIINRIKTRSFGSDAQHLSHVHVLDLHKDGLIKPHIDSSRYCGDVVSGVSLLSDSVMRLRHKDDEETLIVDLLLRRRSLYILSGVARYDFKHEILADAVSKFKEEWIPRDRRISIICRDLPKSVNASPTDKPLDFKNL
uniref:Alpha-ketoglutarate-dependent dioxygenase AlkB-like domain-containing protein n=1 Tax=Plectus sambesii TaxID=2011161 RepID=A0A914UJ51_9BILA